MQDGLTRRVLRVVVLAVVASVIGVPAAQARPAPDDLGSGTAVFVKAKPSSKSAIAYPASVHAKWAAVQAALVKQYGLANRQSRPVYGIGDNMSVYSHPVAKVAKALRPDDRAGIRGIGAALTSNDLSDVFSRALSRFAHSRLDDRLGAGAALPKAGFMRWDKRIVLE